MNNWMYSEVAGDAIAASTDGLIPLGDSQSTAGRPCKLQFHRRRSGRITFVGLRLSYMVASALWLKKTPTAVALIATMTTGEIVDFYTNIRLPTTAEFL